MDEKCPKNYGVFAGPYFPVFGLNAVKYGPEKTPYLGSLRCEYSYDEGSTGKSLKKEVQKYETGFIFRGFLQPVNGSKNPIFKWV